MSGIFVPCPCLVVFDTLSWFSNHAEEERAGYFTIIVLWLSVYFPIVLLVGLQSMIVAFPGLTFSNLRPYWLKHWWKFNCQ